MSKTSATSVLEEGLRILSLNDSRQSTPKAASKSTRPLQSRTNKFDVKPAIKKEEVKHSIDHEKKPSDLFSLSSVEEASNLTRAFFSPATETPSVPLHWFNKDKLMVAQALLVEFHICAPFKNETMPGQKGALPFPPTSMIKCKQMIAANIHINIKQYLSCKAKDGVAYGRVKMYKNRSQLARAIANERSHVKLAQAKEMLLQPLLVSVPF